MMESKRKYLTIDINSTLVFSTVDSFISLKFPVNQVAVTENNKFIINPPLTTARIPFIGKLRLSMNYLAAELTRYHLEVSFLYEAELRGTNPKEKLE